jgi:MYXO-CTERM domain-containing protein
VARHAGAIGALWGEDGKEMPTVVSLAGSSTGTGKAFAQLIPADTTQNVLGTKDPQKLYELAQFSDLAGTVVRGKRNPNNQARGFIYAESNIPNPGWNGGANAFMPEVKTFIGAAVQGYADNGAALLAARESIWLSLLPSTWIAGASTTPGGVTDKPGTNPDGTGPLPRVDGPGTSTDPQAQPPPSVIPGGDSPTPPSGGGPGGNDFNDSAGGCAVSSRGTSGAGGLFLVGLGALLRIRRRAPKRGEN